MNEAEIRHWLKENVRGSDRLKIYSNGITDQNCWIESAETIYIKSKTIEEIPFRISSCDEISIHAPNLKTLNNINYNARLNVLPSYYLEELNSCDLTTFEFPTCYRLQFYSMPHLKVKDLGALRTFYFTINTQPYSAKKINNDMSEYFCDFEDFLQIEVRDRVYLTNFYTANIKNVLSLLDTKLTCSFWISGMTDQLLENSAMLHNIINAHMSKSAKDFVYRKELKMDLAVALIDNGLENCI